MSRTPRVLAVTLVALLALVLAGCGTPRVLGEAKAVAPVSTDNNYIPTDQNLSDCVGTLERPDCGTESKDDTKMYLTFAVLMGGMGLIFWRISVGLRKRNRELEEHIPEHTY